MARHNQTGQWGEEIVRQYLAARGYAIMDSNLHVGHKEIDIVALKGTRIVFVEVKTRTSDLYDPIEAVDNKKILRMCRAADSFLRSHKFNQDPQFDVITVTGSQTDYRVEHYPDAFLPPLSNR